MEKRKNITSKIKAEIVLSLLRGEDPELISREYGVTLADINHWRDQFIESGTDGFKRKPEDSKLSAAERKIGQLQMELELTKKKKERISSKTKKEMISILINEHYPLTGKPYPKRLIFKVVGYSSSTWYENPTPGTGKRGRKPKHSDEEVLQEIKKEIKNSKFNSEGYIKVKKRMAKRKVNALIAGKARVNSIMRENNLLSPNRRPRKANKREHDGTITTDAPNLMWATDGKKFRIDGLGWHWFFGVIDHFNDEIISWHIAKKGNRYAAMEPVRAAVRKTFGSIEKNVCKGINLQLRSDHGTQYDSADFMNEMKYLGLEMSKAFVRSPECNGIIERFHRTLEEQVLQIETFYSFEEAYNSINQFIKDYNTDWIFHRLDYCSPVEYREKYAQSRRKEKDNIPSGNKDPEVQLVLISSGSMPRRNESDKQDIIKGATTLGNDPLEILRYNISPSDQLVRYKSNK